MERIAIFRPDVRPLLWTLHALVRNGAWTAEMIVDTKLFTGSLLDKIGIFTYAAASAMFTGLSEETRKILSERSAPRCVATARAGRTWADLAEEGPGITFRLRGFLGGSGAAMTRPRDVPAASSIRRLALWMLLSDAANEIDRLNAEIASRASDAKGNPP